MFLDDHLQVLEERVHMHPISRWDYPKMNGPPSAQ